MRRGETVVGYARAGTRLGLEAQQAAIAAECERRGWTLLRLEEDGEAGGSGRACALRAVERGEAGALLVASLDLSSAEGKRVAEKFVFVSGWERRLVSERTRAALARRRAQGARLGTPRRAAAPVVEKIGSLRAQGLTLKAIADELNRLRVPTARGGASWRPSSVRSVLNRRS